MDEAQLGVPGAQCRIERFVDAEERLVHPQAVQVHLGRRVADLDWVKDPARGRQPPPAVIVITGPHMAHSTDPNANPEPVPIPTSLDGFIAGWTTPIDFSQWIRGQTGSSPAR